MPSVVSSLLCPENNLKLYVCSRISEIIRLLDGFNYDRNEFDYALYQLEKVAQDGLRSEE